MNRHRGGIAIIAWVSIAGALSAQGYSALRDPEQNVFASFPEADIYRAIVRPVDKAVRADVQKELPFKIHFNELGDHTVYAALRGERPLGLIHVRTEEGRWGLIEIEWRLNLDLTVRGFKFHRCRSRFREAVEDSAFAKGLVGLDLSQLSELLTDEGAISTKAGTIPYGGEELALSVLKSAIKTMILTRSAWRPDIERLLEMDLALRAFPEGLAVCRLYWPDSSSRGTSIRFVRALLVRDKKNRVMGRVVAAEVDRDDDTLSLEWIFDPNGLIRQVDCVNGWPDARTRTTFKQFEGTHIDSVERRPDDNSRLAHDLLAIVEQMKEAGAK